jgi:hypothetical protein
MDSYSSIKYIAARGLGNTMVASHGLRFVLPRRYLRQLTVEAAS